MFIPNVRYVWSADILHSKQGVTQHDLKKLFRISKILILVSIVFNLTSIGSGPVPCEVSQNEKRHFFLDFWCEKPKFIYLSTIHLFGGILGVWGPLFEIF